ncbi:MAG: peptidylprolyl isomerase [Saprospiraceae bacterium]
MSLLFKIQIVLTFSLCILITGYAQKAEDILMKVGSTDVTVGEFRYIYEKNNGANANYSEASINEYLDLYTKFKLKVEKAKQIKLDTIEALKVELDGYRMQLAGSYLIDKEVTEFLLKELYERMKYDVEFSHIFVPVAENAPNQTKQDAIEKLKDIKNKISSGTLTFENAVSTWSDDRATAANGGSMGYFTAKLPSGFYELESAIYKIPVGSVSDVIHTKIGFHLVKVTNKRPSRGLIEVAHILIETPGVEKAENIYNQLKNGSKFEDLLALHSIDKTYSGAGGKLPVFGINTYDVKFEDAAFALINPGDISKPVLTNSGWHIIKLINRLKPDTYEVFVKRMKSQINKDERFNAAKFKLIEDIKKASGYKADLKELSAFTSTLTDEFYSYKWTPDSTLRSDKMLFSIGGNTRYSIKEFADYCKKNSKTRLKYDNTKPLNETVNELFTDYVNQKALEYEEKNLPVKYPDFKSLMREYEEGILLFEITRMHVWDKANQDTSGLKLFFQNHQKSYNWPERATLATINIKSVDKSEIEKIYDFANKNDIQAIQKKYSDKPELVKIIESSCEKQSKDCPNLPWQKGVLSPLEMADNGYKFVKIIDIIPSKPKSLSDARGYAVADYQDYLEKEWIKQLTKEFKVATKQDVLKKLKK